MLIDFVITVLFIAFMLWVGYWFLDWHQIDKSTRIGKMVSKIENFLQYLFHKHRVHIRYKNMFRKLYILFDKLVVHVLNYNYVTGIKKLCKLSVAFAIQVINFIKWINEKIKNKYQKV
jgi:hypothetical protein